MTFRIEVLTQRYHFIHGDSWEWRPVKPSHSEKPYEWATRREAEAMMDMCYPVGSSNYFTSAGERRHRIAEVVS